MSEQKSETQKRKNKITKRCPACREAKLLSDYYKDKRTKSGVRAYCKKCGSIKDKEVRNNRLKSGKCGTCHKKRLKDSVYCEYHWFYHKVRFSRKVGTQKYRKYLKPPSERFVKKLMKKFFEEQDEKCYYTGIKLCPGPGLSLDHIVSRDRGGKSNFSNLCWCATPINYMKNNLSKEDFMQQLREISESVIKKYGKLK